MELTDEKKGIMFRMLAEKTLLETGIAFGLDKHYPKAAGVKARMSRIYQEVRKDPDRYLVSQDIVDMVSRIVSGRKQAGIGNLIHADHATLAEKREVQEAKADDITELVLTGRKKAFNLLHKKLDQVGRNKKTLGEVSLAQLTTTAAILFDKGQIVQGQATENVAVLAKIDSNMSPEDALAAVLRFRDKNILDKEAQKK